MSHDKTPNSHGGGLLNGLLAPLRLPERVIDALESLAEAAAELGPMRSELTRVRERAERISDQADEILGVSKHIREQAQPLGELLPALERLEQTLGGRVDGLREVVERLEGEEAHVNERVGELLQELATMHKTIHGLEDEVEKITERLPDPTRGPLEKARDAITGSDG